MTDREAEEKLKPYVKKLHLFSILVPAGVIGILVGAGLAVLSGMTAGSACLMAGGLALTAGSLVLSGKVKAEYDAAFRAAEGAEIEEIIASFLGPQPEADLKAAKVRIEETIRNSGLCDSFDTMRADSYRMGSRQGMKFEAFNAVLTETAEVTQVDSDGGRVKGKETRTKFDGTWIFADLPREVRSPVLIRSFREQDAAGQAGGRSFRTGDPAFDGRFAVLAVDSGSAAELLTPGVRKAITDLADHAGAECGFCFSGKKLFLAMSGGKRFLAMEGGSAAHIADLKENLRASLQHTCGILDRIRTVGEQMET